MKTEVKNEISIRALINLNTAETPDGCRDEGGECWR